MQTNAQLRCGERFQFLTYKRRDYAGEYIAASAGSQTRVAGAVDVQSPTISDQSSSALQHQYATLLGGEGHRDFFALCLHLCGSAADQSGKLARMRRENRGSVRANSLFLCQWSKRI